MKHHELHRLHRAIMARCGADPAASRTAKLLAAGRGKAAQKLGEEAIEVAIEAVRADAFGGIAEKLRKQAA